MSAFKNKADQAFYEALRGGGATRKQAFVQTIVSRKARRGVDYKPCDLLLFCGDWNIEGEWDKVHEVLHSREAYKGELVPVFRRLNTTDFCVVKPAGDLEWVPLAVTPDPDPIINVNVVPEA